MVIKSQMINIVTILFFGLMLIAIDYYLVIATDYKMSGINMITFMFCMLMVNVAIMLIGDMLRQVLIQILVQEKNMLSKSDKQ